ncbi:MAG: TolC family protein [Bryobacteraceae bacterium]|nr:TolC family protein [Bryobacteraceae bacterium]
MRAFILGLTALWTAGAEERLALRPLMQEALRANPEVLAARKRYEAATHRPARESALPDTMISGGYASTGSPRPLANLGTDPVANIGVMITQELPGPGKRGLRGEIAEREADAEFQQYQAAQLSVLTRVKSAWHRLGAAYDLLDILRSTQNLVQETVKVTEVRYAAGQAAQQDIFKAQTQRAALDLRLERLRQEIRSREAELNALLARQPGTPLGRPLPVPAPEFRLALAELMNAAQKNSPELARERKRIEREELSVNLARKGLQPDYAVSGGYFNMGRMADMYQFRVDITLPVFNRGRVRSEVAERSAELTAARRGFEAAGQTIAFRLQEDYRAAETSRKILDLYRDTLIPQARLTLESSIPAYSQGKVEFLTLLNNLLAVLEYETTSREEELNYVLALVRLEELTALELVEVGA